VLKQSNLIQWAYVIDKRALDIKKEDEEIISKKKQALLSQISALRNKPHGMKWV
jgi:hypothetical protein